MKPILEKKNKLVDDFIGGNWQNLNMNGIRNNSILNNIKVFTFCNYTVNKIMSYILGNTHTVILAISVHNVFNSL